MNKQDTELGYAYRFYDVRADIDIPATIEAIRALKDSKEGGE